MNLFYLFLLAFVSGVKKTIVIILSILLAICCAVAAFFIWYFGKFFFSVLKEKMYQTFKVRSIHSYLPFYAELRNRKFFVAYLQRDEPIFLPNDLVLLVCDPFPSHF